MKKQYSKYNQGDIYFLCIVSISLFPISSLGKVLQRLFQTGFFSFGRQKKWSLVALDRWSSYTVTILWEFAWGDSAQVALGEWSSYRGGRLSRFDCCSSGILNTIYHNSSYLLLFWKKKKFCNFSGILSLAHGDVTKQE